MGSHNSKLSPKDIRKISEKTLFSEEEIKTWHEGFLKDCPTGKLTRSEFLNIYNQSFPGGEPEEFARVLFSLFDENGDGTIEFDEFLMALSVTSRGKVEEKLEWAFKLYDLNGDGSITKEEMLKMIKAIFAMMGKKVQYGDYTAEKRVEKIFEIMDTDHNGKLSKEEFLKGASSDNSIISALTINNQFNDAQIK